MTKWVDNETELLQLQQLAQERRTPSFEIALRYVKFKEGARNVKPMDTQCEENE